MSVSSDRPRLSSKTLGKLNPRAARPGYDHRTLEVGIVHLGVGAFVRAHIATYTDDLLAIEPGHWGIAGVSLRRPDLRDLLAPQDGLYTALQRDGEGTQARVVGCLRRMIVAPEDPGTVVAAMADPSCRIVSLTITEKGYCYDPASGRLDQAHPDIRHDLENPARPRTAIGLITAALAARRIQGLPPFTVLCCDNLPHNGCLVSGLVRDFTAMRDDKLSRWIETTGAFPSTMVDRIVPATTEQDIAAAAEATGLCDAAPVSHESFRQWVIEDRFVDRARPAWDKSGAQFVDDVAPYEHMKLRLLNGAHSALAYLGYLAGYETIADVVADDIFRAYVGRLWDEIIDVVPPPPGTDMRHYAAELLARFGNTAIRHRTWQIAMDGSQKLPQRLLSTVRERLARSQPIPMLALAIAGWIRYVGGSDDAGRPIDVRDPLADHLRSALADAGDDPSRRVETVLRVESIFGDDLPRARGFAAAVGHAYALLLEKGARASAAMSAG
jgi:fructuronate reductase